MLFYLSLIVYLRSSWGRDSRGYILNRNKTGYSHSNYAHFVSTACILRLSMKDNPCKLPPSISYYNTYNCYPDISDWPGVKNTSRRWINLTDTSRSISLKKKEFCRIADLNVNTPVSNSGVIYMDYLSGLTIGRISFGYNSSLIINTDRGAFNHIKLKKEFADDDSILSRLGYAYNGKDYILRKACIEDGYWVLVPDYKIPFTPEPTTYGAVVSLCLLGVGFWRKRKSRLTQSPKKPLGSDTRAA